MGFFDVFPQESGGDLYIGKDEKQNIIDSGIPFQVTEVIYDDENMYEGKKSPRYILVIQLPDATTGEARERRIGFSLGVESRDRMLGQLVEYLDTKDPEDVVLKLTKVGRSQILVQA